jgi:hypothetical protein
VLPGALVALLLGARSARSLGVDNHYYADILKVMKLRKVRLIVLAAIALASHCNAAVIALPNASFESPDFTDGSGLAHIDPGLVFGWNWTGPVNNTQFGIIDPNDFRFLGTTGNGVNRLPSPAEGYQYAFLGGSAQSVSSIQNPAPLATIQPLARYALDIAAINEYAQNTGSGLGTLQLSFLAGPNLVASSSISYDTFAFGQIQLLETSFTTGDSTDLRVGQDLNVRVTYTADFDLGSNGVFDNLVLTATPIPEPGSFALLLSTSIFWLSGLLPQRRKLGA